MKNNDKNILSKYAFHAFVPSKFASNELCQASFHLSQSQYSFFFASVAAMFDIILT